MPAPRLLASSALLLAAAGLLTGCHKQKHKPPKRHHATAVAIDADAATDRGPPGWQDQFADAADGRDWPGYGRSWGEQHFSPLDQIDAKSIARLGLAWSYDLPVGNSVTAPIEVGGTLYCVTGYSVVHALDVATGRQLWTFDPRATQAAGEKLRGGYGSRGLAYWNGRLFVGTQDGRLIAIDAASGRPVWSKMTLDPDDTRFIEGAPRAFAGMVVIGSSIGGVGPGARGALTAYDAETGAQVWRFDTVPGDPATAANSPALAAAAATWSGRWWQWGGGAAIPNAIAYDPATDTLFFGTGTGVPWNRQVRSPGGGANQLVSSIVAVDASSGTLKWQVQLVPGDSWGFGAAQDVELTDLPFRGKTRKLLVTASADGFLYVIDRDAGRLLSAKPYATTSWAKRVDLKTGAPIEQPGSRYEATPVTLAPSPLGAHGWLPMALDPRRHLALVPVTSLQARYDAAGMTAANWQPAGSFALDHGVRIGLSAVPKQKSMGALVAWDIAAQRPAWRVPTPSPASGGVLATAGGIVFQGRIDGRLAAYRARDGRMIWHADVGAPVIAPPISYAVAGRQYVTVITGFTGPWAMLGPLMTPWRLDYQTQGRRVLTFVLGGTAPVPASPQPPLKPLDDPNYAPDAGVAAIGAGVYAQRCVSCHGIDAVAAGAAPDLRRAATILSYEDFDSILRDGLLETEGMPRYGDLDTSSREAVRQYLRARADDLRKGR